MPEVAEHPSFPRLYARTMRFTLGVPKALHVAPDGRRVVFLRTASGTDRAGALWTLDVDTGDERLVADPAVLLGTDDERLSAEERARRERLREGGAGITAYAVDRDARLAAFALSSRLFVADLTGGGPARELPAAGPVVDPRPSPDGRWVAYCANASLHVVGTDGSGGRPVAQPDGPDVAHGMAEFVASEELGRYRGFWWAPTSDALLVARVDESAVPVWHVGDPADPARRPSVHRYPAAGTTNADVSLWLARLDGGPRTEIRWDRTELPYLVAVHWTDRGAPLLQVMTRRQDRFEVLAVDVSDGTTRSVRAVSDDAWVDVVPGVPAWTSDGRLLTVEVVGGRYALCVDGAPSSPDDVQVRAVSPAGDGVLVHATLGLGEQQVYRWSADGWAPVSSRAGWHTATGDAGTVVLSSQALDAPSTTVTVLRGGAGLAEIRSTAVLPPMAPEVRLLTTGPHRMPTAVLFPTGWTPGGPPLPVLMDPYGGPHGPQVVLARRAFLEAQWWADQGFCVVVADGRGTPGEPAWERAVRLDLAGPVLEDQVAALHGVAEEFRGALDLERVGIRGWSFGGFLAALAVLRRPEVFHAAVAGAPVTDWTLYDTAYTERYLGLPDEQPDAYRTSSLLDDAAGLVRPLMIVHGLSDDNVVAAHSLRLSSALLAAGRPHEFLPLSGVTHMTPQEVVAENLLHLQLNFLRRHLALTSLGGASACGRRQQGTAPSWHRRTVPPLDRDDLTALAARQDDVVSRTQLRELGIDADQVSAQVRAGRWTANGPNAVVLHNGPPTLPQRWWAAVIDAGPHACLGAFTALAADGLTGWERPRLDVLVPRGTTVAPQDDVRIHESRRYRPQDDRHPSRLPPRTRTARSVIDAAAWSLSPRTAVGVLAAVVQQRLARVDDMTDELERAGRIRHRRAMAAALVDIGGGSQALSEIDFVRLCRRFGLPEPERQHLRLDASGRRRYLDARWRRRDGRLVVAEVDGALHLLPERYWDDMARDNDLALDGQLLLRFAAFAVRHHPDRVAAQLARALLTT